MYVQSRKIMNSKIQRDQKLQLRFLKSWVQKQATAHARCAQHYQRGGKPPKPSLQANPWTLAYPHPRGS